MNLVLFGSGEFTEQVDDIDKYLIAKFKPGNVAVLPTAAGAESDVDKWIEMAKSHYAKFKLPVIPVPIFNKAEANRQDLVDLIKPAEWIFFSGGNPGYLLEVLEGSELWRVIKDKLEAGTLISGSSAGAMVMGKYLMSSPSFSISKDSKIFWKDAFSLVDYTIIPHFDHFKKHKGFMRGIIKMSPKEVKASWMGIDENTAIIISNQRPYVRGIGSVEIHKSNDVTVLTQENSPLAN